MEKRVRGSNIICSIILRLMGRLSRREEGKGTENFGEEIQIFKMRAGKNFKLQGTLYTTVIFSTFFCSSVRISVIGSRISAHFIK